jgi:hypothetical protein
MLGQTWFEKFALSFHNSPQAKHGRRFHMHPKT